MDTRQKFLEIRRIFWDVLENEVRNYLNRKAVSHDTQLDFPKSKIDFVNDHGDIVFLDGKYKLNGYGEGRNPIMERINGERHSMNSTFRIKNLNNERGIFWLSLESPGGSHSYRSYFDKVWDDIYFLSSVYPVYHLEGEEMLESDDFKKYFLEIIKDLAPERLDEVQKLLA